MKTLLINIPEKQSSLVKQLLTALGLTIQKPDKTNLSNFKQSLANMSVWADEYIKIIEETSYFKIGRE